MGAPRTAVVVLHEPDKGPGMATAALAAAGYQCVTRLRELQPGDAAADLVLVMGGSMGVYEADAFPHLRGVQALLAARLREDRPSVGVCLGAQLLAAAAGARVFPGKPGMELGVYPVQLLPEAAEDPVFSHLPHRVDVAQWHGDTFDPVPGAVRLACTEAYAWQAFRVGRSYGVQFHPELTADALCAWMDDAPDAVHRAGKFVEQIRQDEVPRLRRSEPVLADWWARLLTACADRD